MDEVENVVIPVVGDKVQCRIIALIRKSFALRRESEMLLNEAKEIVEQEIEGGDVQ
jgi:hypothetical protein